MYHVLIVDDEPLICGAISRFLLRSELGISRAETALNGFEALDYLRMDKFDLVITDIQMGGMNGIELMEIIFSEHPGIPVIVISAHEDFKYAQQALRLGALDYLIKPVESQHLSTTVGKVLGKSRSDYLSSMENGVRQKYAVEQLVTTRTIILNEWLAEGGMEWNSCELEAIFTDLDISLPGPYYCVLKTELDLHEGGSRRNTRFSLKDRKLLSFAALNIIQETTGSWDAFSFYGMHEGLISILSVSEQEYRAWGEEAAAQIQLLARSIYGNISNYLQIKSSIGISRFHKEPNMIPALYKEAKEALETRGKGWLDLNVYYIGDLESRLDKLMISWQQQLSGMVKEIRKLSDSSRAVEIADGLLQSLVSMDMPEDQHAGCLLQAAYCLHGLLSEYRDVLEEEERPKEPHSLALVLASPGRREEIRDYLAALASMIITGNTRRENSTVMKAIQFIRGSYANKGLKLQDVAREVHLSPNYFSYLFKKSTDRNLWDYLTEIRMEEAKRLLEHSDKKRYEIAEMIGYESPEHFSRVFKKYYGVSPAEYRK